MTSLQDLLKRAGADLDALGAGWALIGGLAVSARSQPRFTGDVDLAVSVSGDAEAERIVRQLQERGWHVDALVEQDAAERLATVRLLDAPDAGPVLDLLFASSGVEPELVAAAEVLEVFPDQSIPVATLGHLIALKLLARDEQRSQDDSDLRALLGVADPGDRALARDTVRLIEQRGFARGRDLAMALDRLFGH